MGRLFRASSPYNKKHNKIYLGQTEDVAKRLKLYNSSYFKNSHTSIFDGKWVLVYKEEALNRSDALKREKQLKSCRGREFIRNFLKNK